MSISTLMASFLGGGNNSAAPAASAQENNSANSGTIPTSGAPAADGSGPTAFPAVAKEGEKSPLAEYEKLWETAEGDSPAIDPTKELAPAMTLDPAKLQGIAKSIDFSKAVPADIMEKMKSGDSDAILAAMNLVGQAGFSQSLMGTAKLIEKALQTQADNFHQKVMPDLLRKERIGQSLTDPIFENPAVKPMLDMAVKQLSAKNPNASAAEITRQAKDYVRNFAEAVAAGDGKQLVDKVSKEDKSVAAASVDWSDYLTN